MSQFIPFGGIPIIPTWVGKNSINVFDISDESPIGFILEVDLEYPNKLYDLHKDFTLCPEHLVPSSSQCKVLKLITNLLPTNNKQIYIIHYKNKSCGHIDYMNLCKKDVTQLTLFFCGDHGRIDRSGIPRGGGCSLIVVRMFHIFATDSASIE